MQLSRIRGQVIQLMFIRAPHSVMQIVTLRSIDNAERFVCVIDTKTNDLAVVEREAVFAFRESEAPELDVDMLTPLPRFFRGDEC